MGSLSIEHDAVKRNTDCVYFLASPPTCKKGSRCRYRHSEYARINPRVCWFWMKGNCLNRKCSFRHPPLDRFLGTHVKQSAGSSLTPSKLEVSSSMHVCSIASKQFVPCIFFQMGMCLKADKCTFLHGSNAVSTKSPQISKPSSMADPLAFKRSFAGLTNRDQSPKISQRHIAEEVEVRNMKQLQKVKNSPLKPPLVSMIDICGERFPDPHGFSSSYPFVQGPIDHMSSPEGKFLRKSRILKRGYAQVQNFEQIDMINLQHPLSKHRRVSSSLTSTVCRDSDVRSCMEEPGYHEGSVRSRLAGRISKPSNPFSVNGNHYFNSDIDLEMRKNRRTGRPEIPSKVRGFKERVKEGMFNNGRNSRGTEFAAPKTLAETKGGKNGEKRGSLTSQMHYEDDLLFEEPKPLNAILKKKGETAGGDEAICDMECETNDVDLETKSDATVDDRLIESGKEDQDQNVDADAIEYEGIYGEEDELLECDDEYLDKIEGEEKDEFVKRLNAIFN